MRIKRIKTPMHFPCGKMDKVTSAKVLLKRDDTMYDCQKLAELGVNQEFLNFVNDEEAKELLKSMLYRIIKKHDGYA
jgi:hypothetical protein